MASFFNDTPVSPERTTMTQQDALNWFEIPATDLDRAQRFYEALLDIQMSREEAGPQALAVFKYAEGRVGGALVAGPRVSAPSTDGSVVYLDARPTLEDTLARAERLGARLLVPTVKLPGDLGSFAHIADSEGNRVGLHCPGA
jgi:predicted enzyme related to lactoylglutathione lyase